jgi:hypothetical protein
MTESCCAIAIAKTGGLRWRSKSESLDFVSNSEVEPHVSTLLSSQDDEAPHASLSRSMTDWEVGRTPYGHAAKDTFRSGTGGPEDTCHVDCD